MLLAREEVGLAFLSSDGPNKVVSSPTASEWTELRKSVPALQRVGVCACVLSLCV
jgi:hypothetical protein